MPEFSTLHSNVNKPYKFTYSTPNLEVHNGELTSLRSMGSSLVTPTPLFVTTVQTEKCFSMF